VLAENPGGTPYQPPTAAGSNPSSPYYAPPSGSVDSAEQYAGANDAYKRALIRFNQQRTGLLQQYGYAGDINPENGMMQNLRVDGGNVHGALQELLGQQAGEDQNAEYAAEDRGLHGGLAHQAESALHYAHGGQTGRLAQNLLGGLSGLDSQQLDAHSALDTALWQLQHGATTDAVSNADYNPTMTGTAPTATSVAAAHTKAAAKRVSIRPQTKTPVATSKASQVVKKVLANAYTNGSKKRG
jgi:hypothetical protein